MLKLGRLFHMFYHRLLHYVLLLIQQKLMHNQRKLPVQLRSLLHEINVERKHVYLIVALHEFQTCIVRVTVVANYFEHAAPAVALLHITSSFSIICFTFAFCILQMAFRR